jgi:hypothetical protein
MQHSTWDLEVHTREMQQRRWREAIRARQIDEACRRSASPAPRFIVARLATMARTWLLPRRAPVDWVTVPRASEAKPVAEPPATSGARPSRLSQPYAGMVVLARGTGTQTAEQPCGIGDF